MMFKMRKTGILIILIFISIFVFYKVRVMAEENKTLIIYDSYKEFGVEENKLNSLIQVILSTGSGVDIVNVNSYSKESIDKYGVLFILYNNSCKLSRDFIQKLLNFKGKIVWVGKNFNTALENHPGIKYIPDFSSENAGYSALSKEVYELIDNGEPYEPKNYLLLDEVYPFTDLENFIKKIDFLYDHGISFICSVMPVYENDNLDAMKRFCQALKYAQSKGGKIILHSSITKGDNISGKDIQNKMSLAQKIYIKHGVYPLAIDIPEGFLYKQDYNNLIHSSSTVFIEKDSKIGIMDFEKYSISGFNRAINKIDVNDNHSYKSQITYNTAFCFNSDLDLGSFKAGIQHIIDNGIYFNDVEYLDTCIKLGGIELKNQNSDVLLNNELVNDQNSNSKTSAQDDNGGGKSIDIGNANNRIIKITIGICTVFFIIILISRRIERRKFFK